MPPRKNTPARSAPKKQGGGPKGRGPGIGQGKRGQRLRQGGVDYVSPNIAGVQPTGDLYGAYDAGDTMERIRRNEYLNTLSLPDRERAMAQMGYFTGGVPTAVPKSSKREIRAYAKQPGHTAAGVYIMPDRSGQFELDASGNIVKGSVQAYRPAKGKVVGPEKGKAGAKGGKQTAQGGKGARSAQLTSGAKKKSSPGGKKVTAAERRKIQAQKAKQRGKGKGKGGGGGGGGGAEEETTEPTTKPYAEADTTQTSMLRAQGKAYAAGREGYAGGRRGATSGEEGESGAEETEESKRQRRRARRKKTVKKNKRGNYVTRVRKGGKVVSKRTTNKKPGGKK